MVTGSSPSCCARSRARCAQSRARTSSFPLTTRRCATAATASASSWPGGSSVSRMATAVSAAPVAASPSPPCHSRDRQGSPAVALAQAVADTLPDAECRSLGTEGIVHVIAHRRRSRVGFEHARATRCVEPRGDPQGVRVVRRRLAIRAECLRAPARDRGEPEDGRVVTRFDGMVDEPCSVDVAAGLEGDEGPSMDGHPVRPRERVEDRLSCDRVPEPQVRSVAGQDPARHAFVERGRTVWLHSAEQLAGRTAARGSRHRRAPGAPRASAG